ncbi:MAG: ABC transporter ATP-binding protein [Deltaproteobacteria bacterium]|nr:ABC transporter ATP-binding protein [Deltaproteobacteria bacterium]
MRLVARDVGFQYRIGGRNILAGLNFTAEPGSYWCVAGPNGSGKSTFLKAAAGLLPSADVTGDLLWNDKPIVQWTRLELARNIAFVPGNLKSHFPISVSDFVLQGRYARSESFWAQPTSSDSNIAAASIERVGISSLSDSLIGEISAGEAQLALIARALTQEPKILILDEATANLDLRYQLRVFELVKGLNKQGITIFLVSHDLNIAAEFCPNVLWMNDGTVYLQGPMADTLTNELMTDLYGIEGKIEVGKNPFTGKSKVFWK